MKKRTEIKVWWKELPGHIKALAAFISAITVIASATAASVTAIVSALDAKVDEKIVPVTQKLEGIELDTQRIQLLQLMQSDTATVKSVLDVAERYFCELKGDSYVLYEFEQWAGKNNVDVNFVLKCHKATYATH